MTLFHSVLPDVVAEPIAWGSYTQEPDTHYFVCRYVPFTNDLPDAPALATILADLHERATSPTGEFGSLHVGFGGRNPQYFPPSKSWEECFSNGLASIFVMEEETQGPDEEMSRLREGLMTKVIPRLLRPLETEGRVLTPSLVHGDLWDGNAAVDARSGKPVIFDALPLYAHNECRSFSTQLHPLTKTRRADFHRMKSRWDPGGLRDTR